VTKRAPARTKPQLVKVTAAHLCSVPRQPQPAKSYLEMSRFAMLFD
jgi:N-acyl-L-homoserine lactone synthetase